jgi:hypothetical protein
MKTISLPMNGSGPIVRVEVSFVRTTVTNLQRAGKPVLAPLALDALIDTGADASMIEYGLLTPFVQDGVELRAFVHVNAPGLGGLSLHPQFVVGFRVPHPSGVRTSDLSLPAVELIERPLGSSGFQVLIGRDILSRCVFEFDGPADTFTLSY